MGSLHGATVLVTGADGFIGSHLAERLVRAGATVRAFCFYNSQGSKGWLDGVSPDTSAGIDFILGDIRDERHVREVCTGVDVVFHLAALVSIPHSYVAPSSYVETNIRGTLNVLEGARAARCRQIIHTSTSEVYGTPATIPIREDHPLQGQSPYSATKIAADKLCEAFARSYDVPVVVLRPFNTYGPRQSARAVIPTILTQLIAGKTEVSLGSLAPRRDFTFVEDTVEAFVAAAEASLEGGEVVHLGSGRSHSVQQVFDMACRVLDVQAVVTIQSDRVRPSASEVEILVSDPSKARRLLGWEASVDLVEGLRRTAAWLRDSMSRYDPESYAR